MKNTLSIIFVFLSFSLFAQNQKTLESTLEEFRAALINPVDATLLRLTSKDLTYGHSSGVIENQAGFIEALINGPTKYLNVTISNQTIHFVDDLAQVRQNFLAEIKNGEKMSKLDIGVLLIWRKEKSGWKLLARQGFKQ